MQRVDICVFGGRPLIDSITHPIDAAFDGAAHSYPLPAKHKPRDHTGHQQRDDQKERPGQTGQSAEGETANQKTSTCSCVNDNRPAVTSAGRLR